MDPIAQRVIAEYELPPVHSSKALGSAGGFSGAQIWKLICKKSEFCLRRWPSPHPDEQRLKWMHLVLVHAKNNGCPMVAAPIGARNGNLFVIQQNNFWEISKWMPGQADFLQNPTEKRLVNMMRTLAKFHLASAQVSLDFRKSENLISRIRQLTELNSLLQRIQTSACLQIRHEIESFRQMVVSQGPRLAMPLFRDLQKFEDNLFPVQPIIRDVWHDHVLFTGDEVTGIVDFGAMQMDAVSLDIARLLGSTIGDESSRWSPAVAAYSDLRRLNETEIRLLPLLDKSAVLLGSVNWLKWIFVEGRTFENWPLVLTRIEYLKQRLKFWLAATM